MKNEKLILWFKDRNNMAQDMAKACGVGNGTVTGWRQGVRPRPEHMEAIHKFTKGAVPFWSWFDASLMPEAMAAE